MATLKITSFLIVKRKQITSREESLGAYRLEQTLRPGPFTAAPKHLNIIPWLDADAPAVCCAAQDYRSAMESASSGSLSYFAARLLKQPHWFCREKSHFAEAVLG
jgi:hypothetical protein